MAFDFQYLRDLKVGDKVNVGTINNVGVKQPIIWTVISKDHWFNDSNYPVDTVTLFADKIIDFKPFDVEEPLNEDASRRVHGNGRYLTSNIRQWLNTNAIGGSWYYPKNETSPSGYNYNNRDQAPSYQNEDGFLFTFQTNTLKRIIPTAITTSLNTVTDGNNGEFDTYSDKVFLLSKTEIGLGLNGEHSEGFAFSYFEGKSLLSHAVDPLVDAKNPKRKTDYRSPAQWGLRSADINSSYEFNAINEYEELEEDSGKQKANYYHGIRPAINMSYDTVISTKKDEYGAYVVFEDLPPQVEIQSVESNNIKVRVLELEDRLQKTTLTIKNNDVVLYEKDVIYSYHNPLLGNDRITTFLVDLREEKFKGANVVTVKTFDTKGNVGTFNYNMNIDVNRDSKLLTDAIRQEIGSVYFIIDNEPYKIIDYEYAGNDILFTLEKNLKRTLSVNEKLEVSRGTAIPYAELTNSPTTPVSLTSMTFVKSIPNTKDNTVTDVYELEGLGSYFHLSVQLKSLTVLVTIKKPSALFRYSDDI